MNLPLPDTHERTAPSTQMPRCTAIKTILVPVSGSETDRVVLRAAWTIAEPLQAHLELLHLRLKLEEAATRSSEVRCGGLPLQEALDTLAREQANLSASAANYAKQFCLDHGIAFNVTPSGAAQVSADRLEEDGSPTETLLFHARHSDLTVLGRSQHEDCLPANLLEEVLVKSGHPLLIIPKDVQHPLLGTVVVGWKESPASAGAIAAALPLLRVAQRVVLVNIAEDDSPPLKALEGVRQQLAWHGITAEIRCLGDGIGQAERLLPQAVEEMEAGLLVMGGFGHSQLRENFFGGVTSSLLKKAGFPLFMAH